MLSRLGSDYFHTDEGKEAFERINQLFEKKGEPPSFKLLCGDVALSDDTKEFLRNADGYAKSTRQANEVVDSLNEYRKTRLYYSLAKRLLTHLEQPRIDSEKLESMTSRTMSKVQLRRAGEAEIIHMGKDSNIRKMLEEILYNEDTSQCIPTGFTTFDKVNGGMFRGSLVTIGGTSGGGKCCRPETKVELSTLEFHLEDGSILEAEPEEKLLVRQGDRLTFVLASQLGPDDELELDPQVIRQTFLKLASSA